MRLRRRLRATHQRLARVNPRPVVVVGNQKSGTSAIAGLAAERAGVSVTLDIPGFWPVQEAVYRGELAFETVVAANRRDFSRTIVKEPGLTFALDAVRTRFPGAPLVMVVRDPRDNIRSALDRLGVGGRLQERDAAAHLPAGWDRAFDQDALGIRHRHPIAALAMRWRIAAEAGLADDVLLVRYEDFMADKVGTIDLLLDRVGLPRRNDIGHRLDHAFQPPGNRDTDLEDFFGPANLAVIEDVCGEVMTSYGYTNTVGAT